MVSTVEGVAGAAGCGPRLQQLHARGSDFAPQQQRIFSLAAPHAGNACAFGVNIARESPHCVGAAPPKLAAITATSSTQAAKRRSVW